MRSRSRPEWVGGDEEVLPAVSTSSLAFQAVLDDLVRAVDAPDLAPPIPPAPPTPPAPPIPPASPTPEPKGTLWRENDSNSSHDVHFDDVVPAGPPPARLRGRGDLTLVVGLGADAEEAARVLAASADAGAEVQHLGDRRDALAARADGVRRDIPVVAAFPLAGPAAVPALAADLAGIAPDQVWVAVDVSRTFGDTSTWVRAVDAVLAVDAVAATGASFTSTPDDVHRLGLPVLWLDAPPGG
ncbi:MULTISPECIES: hypothetical protein [unclassified Leifsonia]|uniref:hypothetical protein n=1 Tax=unclassified Leifsonia TaxID=2663824 RepID=UPI00035EFC36|nr:MULTISPECIES: hypothetical protein [unclassified Leifsonia]TDQ01757.1 hypothetical protein AXZ95_0016 [Leifsonia sp. 115AMFTsu3.1]